MEKQTSTVFKVGDVVSLKVQPEFRGVIDEFYVKQTNNIRKRINETSVDSLVDTHIWATISYFEKNYEAKYISVPVIHLMGVE